MILQYLKNALSLNIQMVLIHWIIEDMLGTNVFKNGRSGFTNLCIRNRHIIPGNMNVPKTIRLSENLLALFKFADSEHV